jgi:hypothetical protein
MGFHLKFSINISDNACMKLSPLRADLEKDAKEI